MDKNNERLVIVGGNRLEGEIVVCTSKNAVLPILAASILNSGNTILHNISPITDVFNMLNILSTLGCSYRWDNNNNLYINCAKAHSWEIPPDLAREIRSSIFMLGSILSRFRAAKVSYPGGCDIGIRPIDLHLKGLRDLNVKIKEEHGFIICDGSNMKGGNIHLDYPSVGATENLMMAAVLTEGITQIRNAAKEPEITDLQNFINAMGGKISGAGTSTITIQGVETLSDCEYWPMSDRIIGGTYLIACAICGGKIRVNNCQSEYLYALIAKLRESGCEFSIMPDYIDIECNSRPMTAQIIETLPYPGFPTDLQAPMTALQTISEGTCMIIENMFETRFKHCPELIKMGANITVRDRMAIVRGVESLQGAEVTAMDLRGGAALVLAGLAAKGTTIVNNISHIDRGYYLIEEQFKKLGGQIERIA
ncbi:MAG TPA: UDP-N-acetylglucosamine 1-carboxyvinyltransferase [Clostridiales bacterium]|nr:UDP-N-acetylglucosamine 1-carboxyvinyltransferase [Clostridiales bacterium]